MAEVDIYRAYHFKVETGGSIVAHFTEASGLSIKVPSIDFREGGGGAAVRRLPGRVEYGDVQLRYGLTSSTDLWAWLMTAVNGKVERKNASIILVDNDGTTEVTRWNLTDTWPSEWRGASLDAMGQEVAIETLTLVFESLERA